MLELVCDASASMFSSPVPICRDSDSESRLESLDFPMPASAGPSDDEVNAGGPDGDPIRRRTVGTSAVDDVEIPYVKVPMGWSNLQLGPNLQIP